MDFHPLARRKGASPGAIRRAGGVGWESARGFAAAFGAVQRVSEQIGPMGFRGGAKDVGRPSESGGHFVVSAALVAHDGDRATRPASSHPAEGPAHRRGLRPRCEDHQCDARGGNASHEVFGAIIGHQAPFVEIAKLPAHLVGFTPVITSHHHARFRSGSSFPRPLLPRLPVAHTRFLVCPKYRRADINRGSCPFVPGGFPNSLRALREAQNVLPSCYRHDDPANVRRTPNRNQRPVSRPGDAGEFCAIGYCGGC
jgi:hypothetical protein